MGGGGDVGAGGSGYIDERSTSGNISRHRQLSCGVTLCREREHSLFHGEKKKEYSTIQMRDWLWWKFPLQLVLKPLAI